MGTDSNIRKGSQGHELVDILSGRAAVTAGVDFKGKTNSVVARPPLLERVAGTWLEGVEVSSSIFFSAFSVEAVDWEVSRSM